MDCGDCIWWIGGSFATVFGDLLEKREKKGNLLIGEFDED